MGVTADAGVTEPIPVPTSEERLATWERRTRPAIIAAALIPLIGVSTGTEEFGFLGNVIEVACWVAFLVDLVVHVRLHRGYLRSGMGRFDLVVVVLTSPWYLLPGVSAGQAVTLLRLARLARVALIGLKTPMLRKTADRLGKPFLYVGILLMVCAAIVERAEDREHGFENYGDSLWWGVVTITTVGYGDIVPGSRVGRITATVLMLTGVALLGTVAASLASMFRLEDKADEEGDEEEPEEAEESGEPEEADGETRTGSGARGARVAAPAAAAGGDVAAELRALRAEVAALREELARRAP